MIRRVIIAGLIGLLLVGQASAQSSRLPFTVVGADRPQPSGADEQGDIDPLTDLPDGVVYSQQRLDMLAVQLAVTGASALTIETAAGDQVEIPAEQLAVAVQVAGDLSASGVPQEIVLLMDNRGGGLIVESLPQFTPDFELVMHLDDSGDLAISVNEFQDDAGFQPMAQGGEFAGGLLSVVPASDGREAQLISDGVWAMLPFNFVGADTVRLRVETRLLVTHDGGTSQLVADQWPNDGWFTYSPTDGWKAETVNVLEGLDARVSCQLTAIGVVNVRSLPSINGMKVRQIQPGDTATVVSQTVGSDGFVWWRLRDGNWVRSDVVRAEAACRDMPRIEP